MISTLLKTINLLRAKAVGKIEQAPSIVAVFAHSCSCCPKRHQLPVGAGARGDIPTSQPPAKRLVEAQAESRSTKSCCLLTRWVAQAHEVTLPHHGCQLGAKTQLLHRPLPSVGTAAVQTVTGQGINRFAGDMLSPYGQTLIFPSLAAPHLPLKLGEHALAVTLLGQPYLLACERLALSTCPIARGSAARMAFMVLSMNLSLSTHLQKGEGRNVFGGLTRCLTKSNTTVQFGD